MQSYRFPPQLLDTEKLLQYSTVSDGMVGRKTAEDDNSSLFYIPGQLLRHLFCLTLKQCSVQEQIWYASICPIQRCAHLQIFFSISCPLFDDTVVTVIHCPDIKNLLSCLDSSLLIRLLLFFFDQLCICRVIDIIIIKVFF